MTKEEFEHGYATRSGVSVARLHQLGRCAVPCDCGDEMCDGWQMLTRDEVGSPEYSSEYLQRTALKSISTN